MFSFVFFPVTISSLCVCLQPRHALSKARLACYQEVFLGCDVKPVVIRLVAIIALTFYCLVAHSALANSPANSSAEIKNWLERMSVASTALSYKGRFVYNRDGKTSLMEIIHVVGKNGSRERIISLSGEDQELIRDQNGNVYLMNIGPPLLIDQGGRDIPLAVRINANLDRILENYTFELAGIDRVAGYKSQVIDILPLDKYRYSYRLWVDIETGFLTRSQLLDEKGNVVEHIMFSDIELMEEPTELLLEAVLYEQDLAVASKNVAVLQGSILPPLAPQEQVSQQSTTTDNQKEFWSISGVPLGFWRTHSQDKVLLGEKKSVAYLMVTDGLASVSIYIEPFKNAGNDLVGASRSGSLSVYGRVMDEYHITVVGEVPPLTVQRIGDAVIQTRMSSRVSSTTLSVRPEESTLGGQR